MVTSLQDPVLKSNNIITYSFTNHDDIKQKDTIWPKEHVSTSIT